MHHAIGADIGNCEPEFADIPMYELVPLKHLVHGFVAPDDVADANVFDDCAFPAAIMPADQDAKRALANEWGAKRKLTEDIGTKFEVRARSDGQAIVPPPMPLMPVVAPTLPTALDCRPGLPTRSGRGLRAKVFRRKEARPPPAPRSAPCLIRSACRAKNPGGGALPCRTLAPIALRWCPPQSAPPRRRRQPCRLRR